MGGRACLEWNEAECVGEKGGVSTRPLIRTGEWVGGWVGGLALKGTRPSAWANRVVSPHDH